MATEPSTPFPATTTSRSEPLHRAGIERPVDHVYGRLGDEAAGSGALRLSGGEFVDLPVAVRAGRLLEIAAAVSPA